MKPGYKQTEVGVIPEDWEVKTFAQLFAFRNGVNADKESYGEGIRFVNVLEPITFSHLYGPEIPGRVTLPEPVAASFAVRRGDVLFNRTSETEEEVGLAATYLGDDPVVFGGFVIRGRPTDQSLDPTYSGYALRAQYIRSQIIPMGQGAIRANISQQNLSLVVVPVPPPVEQCSIAEALSDADALIESLEHLLDKKRQLKQGALEELLRPNPSDEVRFLGDVSSLKGRIGWQGLKQEEFTTNNDEPFLITGMNFKDGAIRWNEVYHISEARYGVAPDIQLRPNDVLMTKDGTIGKVLYIESIPLPAKASLNSHLLLFRPIGIGYNPKYLYYQLGSRRFQDFIELNKSGTTFFGLSQAAVARYPVLLPPLTEQARIAAVLSDIDTDIAGLEAKLTKDRQLKQGMMQELLTGRIRLV